MTKHPTLYFGKGQNAYNMFIGFSEQKMCAMTERLFHDCLPPGTVKESRLGARQDKIVPAFHILIGEFANRNRTERFGLFSGSRT